MALAAPMPLTADPPAKARSKPAPKTTPCGPHPNDEPSWPRPTPSRAPFPFRRAIQDTKIALVRMFWPPPPEASSSRRTPRLASIERRLLRRLQVELLHELELTVLARRLGHGERTLSHLACELAKGTWMGTAGLQTRPAPRFGGLDHLLVDGIAWTNGDRRNGEEYMPEVKDVLVPLVKGVMRADTLADAVKCIEDLLWEKIVRPAESAGLLP